MEKIEWNYSMYMQKVLVMQGQKVILSDSDIENIIKTLEVINYECAVNFFLHLLLLEYNSVELPDIYENKYKIFKEAYKLDMKKVIKNTIPIRRGAHYLQQSSKITTQYKYPRLDYLKLDLEDLKEYHDFFYKMDLNSILEQMKKNVN